MPDCSFKPYQTEENKKSDLTLKSLFTKSDDHKLSLFAYPDDEGIKKNGGKIGAALGPDSIRTSFYKMTPTSSMKSLTLKDHGNLSFKGSNLKERHNFASSQIEKELLKDKICIGLGGGHDYGYVDGAAFLKASQTKSDSTKPIIVNFDAHFDLRNLDKGISSGTPFFRLIEDFGETFTLFEVGIQSHCNSLSLFDYAKSKEQIKTLHYDDLYPKNEFDFDYFKTSIDKASTAKQDCYISVDIDGFSSALAPGCSQSWPTGFDINSFFKMFHYLTEKFNVKVLGIYEVSPPLDHTELTSRLAALIMYKFLETQASTPFISKDTE